MANDVYTTYTFYGDDLPKFVEDWNKIRELHSDNVDGVDICKFYGLDGIPRCYLYDWFESESGYLSLTFWDAWYPHYDELWPDFYELYGDVNYYIYAFDSDNFGHGFVNTDCNGDYNDTHYRALWTDDEYWNDDYFSSVEEALQCIEGSAKEYVIQKAWDEEDLFDEPNEIVAQSPDLSQDFKDRFGLNL